MLCEISSLEKTTKHKDFFAKNSIYYVFTPMIFKYYLQKTTFRLGSYDLFQITSDSDSIQCKQRCSVQCRVNT